MVGNNIVLLFPRVKTGITFNVVELFQIYQPDYFCIRGVIVFYKGSPANKGEGEKNENVRLRDEKKQNKKQKKTRKTSTELGRDLAISLIFPVPPPCGKKYGIG